MSEELNIQDDADELAAINFCRRSQMAEELTISGETARGISRYIAKVEAESDNELVEVQALAKQLMETSDDLVKQNRRVKDQLAEAVNLLRELDTAIGGVEIHDICMKGEDRAKKVVTAKARAQEFIAAYERTP